MIWHATLIHSPKFWTPTWFGISFKIWILKVIKFSLKFVVFWDSFRRKNSWISGHCANLTKYMVNTATPRINPKGTNFGSVNWCNNTNEITRKPVLTTVLITDLYRSCSWQCAGSRIWNCRDRWKCKRKMNLYYFETKCFLFNECLKFLKKF